MTAQTLTLTDFLLARIAEDEVAAERLRRPSGGDPWGWQPKPHPLQTCGGGARAVHVNPARLLAEAEAKRRIVEAHSDIDPCDAHDGATLETVECDTLRLLALPYADHPDYREQWKP